MANKKTPITETTSEVGQVGLHVFETTLKDEVSKAFLDYAYDVITDRALPDARDGFKPVHRRVLYSMYESGLWPDHAYVKSARVVGECFVKGALVHTPAGLVPIEAINVGDLVLDPKGKSQKVVEAYENPAGEIVQIELNTGHRLRVTPNQLFRVINKEYKEEWIEAKNLEGLTILRLGNRNHISSEDISMIDPNSRISARAYTLGLITSEGYQADRNPRVDYRTRITMTDLPPLKKAEKWAIAEGLRVHWSEIAPQKEHSKKLYRISFSRHEALLAASEPTCAYKNVPEEIMLNKDMWLPYLAGHFDGDGYVRKDRKEICYVTTSPLLAQQIHSMLIELGVISHFHYTNGKPGHPLPSIKLITQGLETRKFAEMLLPFSTLEYKKEGLARLASFDTHRTMSNTDLLAGKALFEAFSAAHIGAGWYQDLQGNKFRQSLDGRTEVRYGKTQKTGVSLVERDFPLKRAIQDGWINKLKRIGSPLGFNLQNLEGYSFAKVSKVSILEEKEKTYDIQVESADHAFIVEGMIVHNCMGKYHPHGDASIYDAMVRMAQDFSLNTPYVDGHGNFGSPNDGPAASRYCVVGGTRLRLANGATVNIESLIPNSALDSDNKIDINVLDQFGNPVHASKFFNSGIHPIKKVNLKGGMSISGSYNHLLLCLVEEGGKPKFKWLTLEELEEGTFVAIAKNAPSVDVKATEDERSLGVLLGAWVSEGWYTEKRAGFNNCDKIFYDEVLDAYKKHVGGKFYTNSRRNTATKRIIHEIDIQNFDALEASPLASHAGLRARDKKVPNEVWNGTPGLKRSFLQALFEGDGTVRINTSKDGKRSGVQVGYSSYSKELINGVQELLLEFGVYSYQSKDTKRGEYRINLGGKDNLREFVKNVNFLTIKKNKIEEMLFHKCMNDSSTSLSKDVVPYVADYVRKSRTKVGGKKWLSKRNFTTAERWRRDREEIIGKIGDNEVLETILPIMDSGYRFEKVTSIEDLPEEAVYSIRVDSEDHSFLAGGFINHNTEARLSKIAEILVSELSEGTVDTVGNYDGSMQEPTVLPVAYPNLLVNGSTGIAVGMATNMIPHNLFEAIAAARLLIKNPKATLDELMAVIPGPDLPTGGTIIGSDQIRLAYETGKGSVRIRGKAEIVPLEGSRGRMSIVITELPYNIGTEKLKEVIIKEITNKRLVGIADAKDLSDRKHGLRFVIECKTGVNPSALLADLYRLTPLETPFSISNLALVKGKPETLGLKQMLEVFIEHRVEVVTRRTQFRLDKAEARKHIVEGLLIALDNIDAVVKIIRASRDTAEARDSLMKKFKLSEIQTNYILETPLRRLVSLEVEGLRKELVELKTAIAGFQKILGDKKELNKVIDGELADVAKNFGVPRKTGLVEGDLKEIIASSASASVPLEVNDDPCTVLLSSTGLLARTAASSEESKSGRKKNGRAKHDLVQASIASSARSQVLLVTNKGRAVRVNVLDLPALPEATGTLSLKSGAPVKDFVTLAPGESLVGIAPATAPEGSLGLAIGTRQGSIKIVTPEWPTRGSEFDVIGLKNGDEIVSAHWLSDSSKEFVFVTSDASLLHFPSNKVRPQGRSGAGMAGIKLEDKVSVISFNAVSIDPADEVMVVSSSGINTKVTPLSAYPGKGRATGGVRCQKFLKSESELRYAWVGKNPSASTDKGDAVDLPAVDPRRDSAGTNTEEFTRIGEVIEKE